MKKQREIIRLVHLLGAAAIGTYVYSPFSQYQWFSLTMQIIVIPLLTLSGIWMWKPKWFRGPSKTINLLTLTLVLVASTNSLQAQEKLKGGSGGFTIGFKSQNMNAYQYFVNENGPQLRNNLIQIGGEGYGLVNRWVIGGGGYYNRGDQFNEANLAYELDGGGGYLNFGYVVFNTEEILVFPLLGVGIDALGIESRINEDIFFDPDRFLQTNYFVVSPILDIGAGIDWLPSNKGFKLGIRAGYNLSFSETNDWRHYGGKITDNNLPYSNSDGFYVQLTIGGGHFGVN